VRRLLKYWHFAALATPLVPLAIWLAPDILGPPVEIHACADATGVTSYATDTTAFAKCIEWRATVFRDHDYPDKKHIVETMLYWAGGILLGILTLSFSEKLRPLRLWPIVGAQTALVLTILCSGMAWALYTQAASSSWYVPNTFYWHTASKAKLLMLVAGPSFAVAIILLFVAWILWLRGPSQIVRPNEAVVRDAGDRIRRLG
jgi:hypothetical protein